MKLDFSLIKQILSEVEMDKITGRDFNDIEGLQKNYIFEELSFYSSQEDIVHTNILFYHIDYLYQINYLYS